MDFSTLVEYDRTYPVKIYHPITGKETGIVVNVVSSDSKRVVDALRAVQGKRWAEQAVGSADGEAAPKPDAASALADAMAERARVVMIHSIDSWQWPDDGGFAHIKSDAAPSVEDRTFLVDHPNAGWIRDQIASGCANLENFTQPSQKNAPRGSKKT